MYAPKIQSARPIRRYQLGDYQAALFDQIVSAGPIRYLYVLVVRQAGQAQPCLFVASEESEMPPALGPSPPFLGTFDENGHDNFGASPEWADLETFTVRALQMAADRLKVDEPPTVVSSEM